MSAAITGMRVGAFVILTDDEGLRHAVRLGSVLALSDADSCQDTAILQGSYWVPGWCRVRHATRPAMRAPSKALPRRRALCTNWKKPR